MQLRRPLALFPPTEALLSALSLRRAHLLAPGVPKCLTQPPGRRLTTRLVKKSAVAKVTSRQLAPP